MLIFGAVQEKRLSSKRDPTLDITFPKFQDLALEDLHASSPSKSQRDTELEIVFTVLF